MATMNPLDSEGTYALPIAQMDRFLMKVNVGYPTREEELLILDRFAIADTQPRARVADARRRSRLARRRRTPCTSTRSSSATSSTWSRSRATRDSVDVQCADAAPRCSAAELIDYGASPRATLALAFLARGARASCDGRDFALPDDVRAVAAHALRHRIGFNYRLATEASAPTPSSTR